MTPVTQALGVEQSRSWPVRMAGKIPPFVDVFMLIGIDPDTERYVGWGYFESTTEPPPWPTCRGVVMNVASTTVHLTERSDRGLKAALKQACDALSETVWKSTEPAYVRIRNKLAEDLAFLRARGQVGGAVIEKVDEAAFQHLLQTGRLA